MATGKSGILGKLTGSLDGITCYNLKGTNVIRKKAVQVRNPDTPNQQINRNNVSFAISLFNQLKGFLHYSLASRAKKQSLLSEFLRLNLGKSIVNSVLDFDKLVYYSSSEEKIVVEINQDDLNAGTINGTII
jgi:hypothetical protein